MARPKTLPDFNFKIPPVIYSDFSESIIKATKRAIVATQHQEKHWELRWLTAYNRALAYLFRTQNVLTGKKASSVTPEMKEALEWLRHKGKHDWEPKRTASKGSQSSETRKEGSRKVGASTRVKKTKTHIIPDTTVGHSATNTSIESKQQ